MIRIRTILTLTIGLLAAGRSISAASAYRQSQAAVDSIEQTAYSTSDPELPDLTGPASLEDFLTYAALRNPGLKAAFYTWKEALDRVPQARSLADPKFTYGYFIRPIETRVGPQEHRLEIGQMFPWFGTLRAKGEVAFRHAEMQRHTFEAARLSLCYKVKNWYYEYYFLGRALRVTRENLDLLAYWEKVITKRYAAAQAGQPDLIKTQIEISKLNDQAQTLENGLATVEAQLRSVLNYREEALLPVPEEVADVTVQTDRHAVINTLISRNPDLAAGTEMIAREEAKLALARKRYFPDFMLGASYMMTGEAANPGMLQPGESGTDPATVMASVNIPLWYGKNRAGTEEAEAAREAAAAMRENRENMLRARAVTLINTITDQKRQAVLYRENLIPKARLALQTVEALYMTGKKDILNIIDLERTLLQFQLMGVRAHSRFLQKAAELEMLTGGTGR